MQDDDLLEWVQKRHGIFEKPTEETFLEMQYIMHGYKNYAALSGSRNDADPWVIAHARLSKAIVLTYEEFVANPKSTKPPKIPNVCDDLDINWVDIIGFLEACGVVFKTA